MSAFGSSAISKSSKKLAPKAPVQRRRTAPSAAAVVVATQTTTETATKKHTLPETSQDVRQLSPHTPPIEQAELAQTGATTSFSHSAPAPTPVNDAQLIQSEGHIPQKTRSQRFEKAQSSSELPSTEGVEPDTGLGAAPQISPSKTVWTTAPGSASVKDSTGPIAIPVPTSVRSDVKPTEHVAKRRRTTNQLSAITDKRKGPINKTQTPHNEPPMITPSSTAPSTEPEQSPASIDQPSIASQKAESKTISKRRTKRRAPEETSAAESQSLDNGTRKGRTRRAETPENSEVVEIAPALVKMSDLCKDLRTGKKSKRETELQKLDWTEVVNKQRDRKARRARGELPPRETVDQRLERAERERTLAQQGGVAAPQMRIVNGQLVLDDQSLHVDRHANAFATAEEREEIEENALTHRVTAGSWMRREKTEPWDEELTDRFYQGLRTFGTDFMIISGMFPGRTRRQIKLKFCKEERLHPERINEALLGPKAPMDLAEYSRHTNTEYEDPEVFRLELEEEARQHAVEQSRQKEAQEAVLRQKQADAAGGDQDLPDSSAKQDDTKAVGGTPAPTRKGKKTATKRKKGLSARGTAAEEVEILGTIEDVARREIPSV